MSGYDVYVFILCLIVFAILVGLSSAMLTIIVKSTVKLIRLGAEDENIKKEYQNAKKRNCKGVDFILSLLLCVILCVAFIFSVVVGFRETSFSETIPTLKVVNSASMAKKHEKNEYLFENDLGNQFNTFDIIFTYKTPDEFDLKLYDIVVYEVDGVYLVHRIVRIEEPNSVHPNERYFLCQGDAVESPDRFPVRYSQIKGIYRGERIPFVGSLVKFMQSPAGWLCILLVVAAMIVTPLIEKLITKEKAARYLIIAPEAAVSADELPERVIENANDKENALEELNSKRNFKTFKQRLKESDAVVKERYSSVQSLLLKIKGIRIIDGKTQRNYKCKSAPILRFTFRGKTLNAYLGLEPKTYEDSKYIFTDVSSVIKHANYPMRLKLTSERQTRWCKELILDIVKNNGFTLLENPVSERSVLVGAKSKKKKDTRSFDERLKDLPIATERYSKIKAILDSIETVRVIDGKGQKTFKYGNAPIARFALRKNILNAYLALTVQDFGNDAYMHHDVSSVIKHSNYPFRVPVTSDVQADWVCELIEKILKNNGVTVGGDYEN